MSCFYTKEPRELEELEIDYSLVVFKEATVKIIQDINISRMKYVQNVKEQIGDGNQS